MPRFFLRVLLVTVLRFFALLALIVLLHRFDVSPLPEWTLLAFGYVMQFVITMLCAMFAMRRVAVDARHIATVAIIFVLLGTALEGGLLLFLTHARWQDVFASYRIESVWLALWYVAAVVTAGWERRSHKS